MTSGCDVSGFNRLRQSGDQSRRQGLTLKKRVCIPHLHLSASPSTSQGEIRTGRACCGCSCKKTPCAPPRGLRGCPLVFGRTCTPMRVGRWKDRPQIRVTLTKRLTGFFGLAAELGLRHQGTRRAPRVLSPWRPLRGSNPRFSRERAAS